jgi:hypothetical protein
MANCPGCYWADRHPDTHIQAKHFEPDYLNQNIKAGAAPPDIRVVRSCGAGARFFESFGSQEHNCQHFIDEAQASEEEEEQIEKKRAKWKHPTSRKRLPVTQNMLLVIERMAEGNNAAFDLLTDMMAQAGDDLPAILTILDDMNIRGGQIAVANSYCNENELGLIEAVKARDPAMVGYVNKHYKRSETERAVVRGAHLYGHK